MLFNGDMTFTPKTQEIIDRLSKIDKENPILDKDTIEKCLEEHFKLLNLNMLPVKWVGNAKDGYKYVANIARSAAYDAAWSAAWSAAGSAVRSAAWSAVRSAADSAAWFNCSNNKGVLHYAGIWLPFLQAKECGLWLYWITEKEIVCCLAPSLKITNERLHCETGPAVSWPDDEYYFLNGVQMKKCQVMTPAERLDPKDILNEKNVEVRRELIRKIGIERFLQVTKHKILDKRDNYELLSIELSNEIKDAKYLKMINPSIKIFHVEGVHPSCKTVQHAINWRAFGDINKPWSPEILT